MPFSTYLRDSAPNDVHADARQSQQQQSQQYPTHGGAAYSSYGSGSYYPPHTSSSNTNTGGTATDPSKPYNPPSIAGGGGNGSDGLFQMPSFLMGNFAGTLAPGGGAEVLTPSAFDFFSTTPFSATSTGTAHSHPHDDDDGKSSWQSAKYYALERPTDDVAQTHALSATGAATTAANAPGSAPAPPPLSASASEGHVSAPAASPFGYLNVESPQHEQQGPVSASASASAPAPDTDWLDEAAAVAVSSPVEPSSAMTEPGAYRAPMKLYAPIPPSGLPVYSQSGFDMLSILARVARRPNPTITLGPVDLTCAFVVADVRRADAPVVYASRTFCELTGYSEGEVLGRNCRFLQAPGGRVVRNDVRRFTSAEAVREIRFALDKDREVQVSLINYRKDGRPFVNRVSIVPIPAEDGASEIAFHVGFQVNLNDQPNVIAKRIQEGKFYSGGYGDATFKSLTPAERSARAMGKKLRSLLSSESFQSTVPITTTCNSVPSAAPPASNNNPDSTNTKSNVSARPDARDERQWLNLILLEQMPDFIHVLSLKGHFLYVSPGITRSLGFSPADLIGKSVGDFCHPSDAVPLLRELKESTGQANTNDGQQEAGSGNTVGEGQESQAHGQQRIVNLLFRMRAKKGEYVWVESTGRLHVEGGKGRKAIVLSGRLCAMPNLRWGVISQAGGLLGLPASSPNDGSESSESETSRSTSIEREFWAMLCEDGLFLVAGMGVRDLLGWGTAEMIGRSIREFILDDSDNPGHHHQHSTSSEQVVHALRGAYSGEQDTQSLTCQMKKRDGEVAWMQLTLYANETRTASGRIIVQFKLLPTSNPPYAALGNPFSPTGPINPAYPFSFNSSHPHTHPSYSYDGRSTTISSMTASVSSSTGRILHQPSTNVFAEFETHRGTSWQYELQQLKYANDKLRQEVNALEARQRRHQQRQHQHQQHQHPQQHPQQQHQQQQPQQQHQHQQAVWIGSVRA